MIFNPDNPLETLDVGLIIFTKDEEKTIGKLLDSVSAYVDKKDTFVIDGYSKDTTLSIVKSKGVNIFFDSKKGKGNAVKLAVDKIERDVLIFMDSDGSHRPEEIPSLLEPFLRDKNVDMVIGSRFKGGSEEFFGSFREIIRFIGNILGTFFINLIWRSRLTDVQNGFRAVKKEVIKKLSLNEDSFAIEQEMVMKCLKNRKKIVEVPSWELRRKYGVSKLVPIKMLPKYITSFIKNILYE